MNIYWAISLLLVTNTAHSYNFCCLWVIKITIDPKINYQEGTAWKSGQPSFHVSLNDIEMCHPMHVRPARCTSTMYAAILGSPGRLMLSTNNKKNNRLSYTSKAPKISFIWLFCNNMTPLWALSGIAWLYRIISSGILVVDCYKIWNLSTGNIM